MKREIIYRLLFGAGIAFFIGSCSPMKMQMAVPERFKEQAVEMPVTLAGMGEGRKPINFGSYKTSRIKRGWNITTGRYDRNSNITAEERVLNAFRIERGSMTKTQKDRFQFTIQDGKQIADVYALEREVTEGTQITSKNRFLSDFYQEKSFQYSFSAVIVPGDIDPKGDWSLFMYSTYDWSRPKKFMEMADFNEGGTLIRDQDTIVIRTIKINKVVSNKGQGYSLPFALPMAYEMRLEDGVCAIIDTWGKVVWMYRELDEPTKLAIAATASAILSRRIQNRVGGG